MRRRPFFWLVLSLLCFAGAVYFWKLGDDWAARKKAAPTSTTPEVPAQPAPSQSATSPRAASQAAPLQVSTSKALARLTNSSALTHRVSNTTNSVGKLNRIDTAIILENALIDTANKTELPIPDHMRSHGNPGAYIVQARGPINDAFRAALQGADATIVSYIPNNAYLVKATQDLALSLSSSGLVQSVLPYEPYYKLKPSLLEPALNQQFVPEGTVLNLLLFPDTVASATTDLNSLGAQIVGPVDRSPFGPVLHVIPPRDALPAIAQLPSVQEMELARPRITANDLSRVTLGVSPDSITSTNYLDLSGTNITVGVIDTGIDATHPDLTPRIFMDQPDSGVDTDGHGTFVAGMIAGTGFESTTVTNAQGSIMPGTNGQFRGKAPIANLFSMSLANGSDTYFQETAAAQPKLLIANNSWSYGNSDYDLAAASYDAAVRDAIPEQTGSQPLLYVFPSGNAGGANVWDGGVNDGGTGGVADTIQSPGTAKNVITVGAIEQFRNITNQTFEVVGIDTNGQPLYQTNFPWQASTDSSDQVAGFSGRGNVGIGIEGDSGRFKPDVVAPGTFVISTRSSQWDTNSYYNPTSHTFQFFPGIVLHTNATLFNEVFLPFNCVGLSLEVFPNARTPQPFPDMPIFVREGQLPVLTNGPGGYLFVRSNVVNMPPDGGTPISGVDDFWFYGIPNPSKTNTVIFDLLVDVAITNAHGNFLAELKTNLNDPIGPWYRYESGTSIAAADASGLLALMEEFLEQRSGMFGPTNRPSPALMKAMLINGSRSVGDTYDFDVHTPINFQGWGLPNLPNSLPTSLSNINTTAATGSSMYIFEQSPTNALSTGQKQTRLISLNPDAQNAPLHITLAWTDPPGNPIAGKKLVNDLDLVVTNLDTGDVFFGNDIIAGNDYNVAWDTNSIPNVDVVNNVENVYLLNPLGSNYSVTVIGSRVNVNAVTLQKNQVVQDYALVISSDANFTNGLTLPTSVTSTNGGIGSISADPAPPNPPTVPLLTVITNQFAAIDTNISGGILLNQRVGASTPLLGTSTVPPSNTVPLMGPTAGLITIGMTNQWHFYVLTNENGFTNAAFLTFLPATLSLPRIGVRADTTDNSTRPEADIDLYVSTDPALTNLNPTVLSNSLKSLTRDGTETIALTNAVKGTYYLAVKAEDQEASEYAIAGLFSLLPFDQNQDGNHLLMGIPSPAPIPDGSTKHPGGVNILAICTGPITIHRVIVTNTISHQLVGDLEGTLTHSRTGVVLNNHTAGGQVVNQVYLYDDSDQHDVFLGPKAAQRTDGPGSLMNFGGQQGAGQWMLTMVDDALGHTGTNQQLWIFLEKQQDLGNGVTNIIRPNACVQDFIDVPIGATNLTITAGLLGGNGPVTVTVCPQDGGGCVSTNIGTGFGNTNVIVIDKFSNPSLNPGTYVVTSCNHGSDVATEYLLAKIAVDINGVVPTRFTSSGPVTIADDAVTTSSLFVTNDNKVVSVEVGLRVDHPRVSDLVFHLISPNGTRSLLFENRGGLTPSGMGTSIITSNIVPTTSTGGPEPQTNSVNTGISNWTATINYNMFTIPDEMAVYSGNILLTNTGLVSGTGVINLTNPPGGSSVITIIMNPNGNPQQGTAWEYTLTSVHAQYQYFTFTEDTNKTVTPIKFALPPFVSGSSNATANIFSDFESSPPGTYTTGVDGWTVTSNQVAVVNATANTGNNSLVLGNGSIGRLLPTVPGQSYTLGFAYRQRPTMQGLAAWWPGEGNFTDIIGANNGTGNAMSFIPGEVGEAFNFNGSSSYTQVPATPALNVGQSNGFSFEAWVYPRSPVSPPLQTICMWNQNNGVSSGVQQLGAHMQIGGFGPGDLYANITDTSFISHNFGSVNYLMQTNAWQHVAVTYDKTTGAAVLYWNGTVVRSQNLGIFTPLTSYDFFLGYTASGNFTGSYFNGGIDEPSIYNRVLSPAEVQSIYAAGALGKCGLTVPPAVCPLGGDATLNLNQGLVVQQITPTTNWQTQTFTFTATTNNTPLTIAPVSGVSDVAFDSFTLSGLGNTYYVLPEETLDKLKTQSAKGQWQLEVWDNRAGPTVATNSSLVSWQLSFIFENPVPPPIPLVHADPVTNNVCSQIQIYSVAVPFWALFASNQLLSASTPVTVWFNPTQPPTGGGPGDIPILSGSTGTFTLATGGAPPLVPGQTYYLGVQNTSGGCSEVGLQVNFNVTPLTLNLPSNGSAQSSNSVPQYFSYEVTSNETWVQFLLTNYTPGCEVDIYASKGLPFPSPENYDYVSAFPGTNQDIVIFTNSTPVALSAGTWYLGAFSHCPGPNNYTVTVTDSTNPVPNIIQLYLNSPYANTNTGAPDYYRYTVTPNETGVEFRLLGLSGDVNLIARRGFPPPSLVPPPGFDYGSFNPGTNDEEIFVLTNSTPFPLGAGDWYLTVINTNVPPGTISYTALVTDTTSPIGNIITLTNAIPYGNTNNYPLGGATTNDYYRFVVDTNAVRAQFEIDNPSAHVALAVSRGLPLPSLTLNDYLSNNGGTNNQLITVFNYSAPVPLSAGEWFLTAINLSGVPVNYSIKATEFLAYGTNIVIGHPTIVSNEFCFSWSSLPGVPYTVQGKPLLDVTNWTTIETVIGFSGTNLTTACIPLPSPYQFFHVIEGYPVSTNATYKVQITSITRTPAGVLLKWLGPIGSIFQVQWSSGGLPPVWNTFTNVITSTNGQCSFLDDGSQSGGLGGGSRYYRLVQ
jgi:subtilisin-like proprotein convertase family protein